MSALPGALIRRLAARERFCFYRVVPQTDRTVPDEVPGLHFRALLPSDFGRDPIFASKDRARRFLKRAEGPHRCFGFVTADGQVAAYIWLSMPRPGMDTVPLAQGVALQLEDGQAYVWDCRTAEQHRNLGLYRQALVRAQEISGTDGCGLIAISCHVDNAASRRGIEAAGFDLVSKIDVRRLLHYRLVNRSSDGAYRFVSGVGSLPLDFFLGTPGGPDRFR